MNHLQCLEALADAPELDGRHQIAVPSTVTLTGLSVPPKTVMALGVYYALNELKLRVPRDVSVISIDDFDFAAIMSPPPTVVAAPVAEMAQRAIAILLEEIASKRRPSGVRQLFSPTFVVRGSISRRS